MRRLLLISVIPLILLSSPIQALPDGIIAVTPAPDETGVSVDTGLTLTFPVPITFAYTEQRKLRVIETVTGHEVFAIDPDTSDPQSGATSYSVSLPTGTLRHGTAYHVMLDRGFALINQAPWKTGEHDGSEWRFTTAALTPVDIGIANITGVYPPPGAAGVPVDTNIELTFPAPADFGYTENHYLVVRDLHSGTVVFEADPEITDPQQGSTSYSINPTPDLLKPNRSYEVTVDYAFAGINVAPWKTGAIEPGAWQFTTGAESPGTIATPVDGIMSVSPAPGTTSVSPATSLRLLFTAETTFANTVGSRLRVIEVATQEEVFSFDPDESHIANGSKSLVVELPAETLKELTEYAVVLDFRFANFTAPPWRSTVLAAGDWTFTTGRIDPLALEPATNGIIAVYPPPGSTNVPRSAPIEVHFTSRSSFGYTENSVLALIDTRDESLVASVDPMYLDAQDGKWLYAFQPPELLDAGVQYRVELDYSFARFNDAPWISGAGAFEFTVAGNALPPVVENPPPEAPEVPEDPELPNAPDDPVPPLDDPVVVDDGEPPVDSDPPTETETGNSGMPQITTTSGTVLFVTQTPVAGVSFGTVVNNFSNHVPSAIRTPRGGDLWIRYPDGTLRNLTAEAGYGEDGAQQAAAVAVRDPSVHWDGDRALFSMVIGSPDLYETTPYYWQIYEVTGLGQGQQVSISKVSNQPADYNNVEAIYSATGNDIIFASDMTPGGRHLYPQYEEYDGAQTTTGLFRLNPATGDLLRLTHAPSGDFSPLIDGFGRLIFVRWDHLQQDQQNGNLIGGVERFGSAINFVDESPNAPVDANGAVDVFPEHLVQVNPATGMPFVVGNETGHRFNQFFLWESSPIDGSGNEVLNHLGRQELGQSYTIGRFIDDAALADITSSIQGGHTANTVPIIAPGGTFHPAEDPHQAGAFYMTHAQEFGFCGEIIFVQATPGTNPEEIAFQKVTDYFGAATIDGCYRNPLPMADGALVAAWSPFDFANETGEGDGFRLRFVNEDGTPGGFLTSGINESVTYYNPDFQVSFSGNLWELDPVEVRARPRPTPVQTQSTALDLPEQLACEAAMGGATACNDTMAALRVYLETNKLALVVSRDVTARDDADTQQPFNLRVPGGVTADASFGLEKVYDVTHLQFLQANLVRGYSNRPTGRRPLAQTISDDLGDGLNASSLGAVEIGADGSVAAIVPAERAVTWHLVDAAQANKSVVSERYWVSFAAGEVRVCANCHGINDRDQMGNLSPTNPPQALTQFLLRWQSAQPASESLP